jgi:hypothetical protein
MHSRYDSFPLTVRIRDATLNDLRIAETTAIADALVFLDDILSSHWLGVITGLFDYLSAKGSLAPVAIVPNKLIMSRSRHGVDACKSFLRTSCSSAISKTDVDLFGFPVDVIEDDLTVCPT